MSENNSVISRTVINVSSAFLRQESKINEKLDDILVKKLEKLNFDEDKYSEVLKFNILFYKKLIRNIEPLIGQWVELKSIPNIDSLEKDLEVTAEKCRQYINKIKEDGVENLKEGDLKSFNAYDEIKGKDKVKRLEKDYKVLNVYKDLLNITLRKISLDRNENLSLLSKDPIEVKRELKREVVLSVNKILLKSEDFSEGNFNKQDENRMECLENIYESGFDYGQSVLKKDLDNYYSGATNKGNKNNLEESFLRKIKSLNYEVLFEIIENEYKKLCSLEELAYSEGNGFGKGAIAEFASAVILLEFVKEQERDIIEGAMRLVIIGEFGGQNFQAYMLYVVNDRVDIDLEVWDEAISIIKNKYQQLRNHDIALKEVAPSKDIDIEEYIYMIEHADKDECFRNAIQKSSTDEIIEEVDDYEYIDTIEPKTPEERKQKIKKVLIGATIAATVAGAFGTGYTVITNREKKAQLEIKRQEALAEAQENKEKDTESKNKSENTKDDKEKPQNDREAMIKSKMEEMESYAEGKGLYYIVYAGSHKLRENAEETLEEYRAKNVDGTIVEENEHFRIKIGEYTDYALAKSMCKELSTKSIETYILQGDKYYDCKIDLFKEQAKDISPVEAEIEYYSLREELEQNAKNKEYAKKLDKVYESMSQGN